jgi:D-amino-acid oxidase
VDLPTPNLADDQILRIVAGLRPCRHGGLRLEAETLEAGGGRKLIIHNYGHGGCGVTIGFGCAEIAVGLAEQALGEPPRDTTDAERPAAPGAPVAVLGAGVIGLTTALELLRRGHSVTVYAERAGLDTTSALAGALWLPTGIEFDASRAQIEQFTSIVRRSREALAALDREQWGVERLPVYEPRPGDPAHEAEAARFAEIGAIAAPRALDRLPLPGPSRAGIMYETEFIHTPHFLRALAAEVDRRGGRLVPRRFESLAEVAALREPVAINCLALGSRALFGDEAVYPARGVLVHMRPQPLGYCLHDGYWYIFPREDALILGGSFEPDIWDPTPDNDTARAILTHHRAFFNAR